jgi:hypothetical protein
MEGGSGRPFLSREDAVLSLMAPQPNPDNTDNVSAMGKLPEYHQHQPKLHASKRVRKQHELQNNTPHISS